MNLYKKRTQQNVVFLSVFFFINRTFEMVHFSFVQPIQTDKQTENVSQSKKKIHFNILIHWRKERYKMAGITKMGLYGRHRSHNII